MPAVTPRIHLNATLAPHQVDCLTAAAEHLGVSRRAYLERLITEFIESRGLVHPPYAKDDRQRFRFHVGAKTYRQLQQLADREACPLSAIAYSAVSRVYPHPPKALRARRVAVDRT